MKNRLCVTIVFLLSLCLATTVQANIYMKVQGDGEFSVTNSPDDASFIKIVETRGGEKLQEHADKIQQAVERAAAKYRLPQSLIFSILRAYKGSQGVMPIPDDYLVEHGDTILQEPGQNILVSVNHFQQMLKRYEGNLTLTLAAFYNSPEKVDKVGGVPPDAQVKQFVNNVQKSFDKLEKRSSIIYTYRDRSGTLHVVNIR